jgi:putative ABC transport system permease protein
MIDSLYIAWKYISFNKIKTATLVACITLISFLPFALQLLLNESGRQLMSRAAETPLVVGRKGSALDLVMNTLYFGDDVPEMMTMAASDRIAETDLALPIPMYVRFQARGNPIVGTTLDYFEFRGLQIAKGRQLAVLGDCVLGARVAKSLALKPGDSRMTIAKMIAAEILIIVVCSAFLCGIMMVAVQSISNDIVRMLFIR